MTDKSKIARLIGEARPDNHKPVAEPTRPRASVLIFSPIRPRRYVSKMARIIAGARTKEWGEELLRRDMALIRKDLLEAGADPAAVHREVGALEGAIRAELWRIVLTPEDAR